MSGLSVLFQQAVGHSMLVSQPGERGTHIAPMSFTATESDEDSCDSLGRKGEDAGKRGNVRTRDQYEDEGVCVSSER